MKDLKEGIDYYYNGEGLMTFTEHYLRERGFCCEQGCRHCPYGFTLNDEGELNKLLKSKGNQKK